MAEKEKGNRQIVLFLVFSFYPSNGPEGKYLKYGTGEAYSGLPFVKFGGKNVCLLPGFHTLGGSLCFNHFIENL